MVIFQLVLYKFAHPTSPKHLNECSVGINMSIVLFSNSSMIAVDYWAISNRNGGPQTRASSHISKSVFASLPLLSFFRLHSSRFFKPLFERSSSGMDFEVVILWYGDRGLNHVFSTQTFTVRHFAGPVTYHVDGWIDKNNDRVRSIPAFLPLPSLAQIAPEIEMALTNSKHHIIQRLLPIKPEIGDSKPACTKIGKFNSIGKRYISGHPFHMTISDLSLMSI